MVFETDRLYLRQLTLEDALLLSKVLSNKASMIYYPHPFSEEEVLHWIGWNIDNYEKYGHGLWAVILKEGDIFLGDCGITMQDIEGAIVPEIGFHILPDYCGNGYATEAAIGCRDYAFNILKYDRVYSYTTQRNIPSLNVAKKMGMTLYKTFIRHGEKQIVQMVERSDANKEEYVFKCLPKEELQLIKPLWKKLNRIHQQKSVYFSHQFEVATFDMRIDKFVHISPECFRLEVVEDNQNIIGYSISFIDKETSIGVLASIYVEEAYRGRGIGEQLLEKAKRWQIQEGCSKLELSVAVGNEDVLAFYQKAGYFPRTQRLYYKEEKSK